MATADRWAVEFARLMGHVIEQYPFAQSIHLVVDHLNIHCRKSLVGFYGEQDGGNLWERLNVDRRESRSRAFFASAAAKRDRKDLRYAVRMFPGWVPR